MLATVISVILFIALATQKLTDILKTYLPDVQSKLPFPRYIALVVALVLAFALNADLLKALGYVSAIPYLGFVITGIVCSMGSSYLNDFLGLVNFNATPTDFSHLASALAPHEDSPVPSQGTQGTGGVSYVVNYPPPTGNTEGVQNPAVQHLDERGVT